jgi:hypothetical protein
MNNEDMTNILITTFLLIFGFYCLILFIRSMKEIKGESRNNYQVSRAQVTRAQSKPYLTTRRIQERERLRQLVRAHVQVDCNRTCRRMSK